MVQKVNNIKILYNNLILKLLKSNLNKGNYDCLNKKIKKQLYYKKKNSNIIFFFYNMIIHSNTYLQIKKQKKNINIQIMDSDKQFNVSIKKIKNLSINDNSITNKLINDKLNNYNIIKKNKFNIKGVKSIVYR